MEVNLLQETVKILKKHGKTLEDIKWVGCEEFQIPLKDLPRLFNILYDDGYGSQHIVVDLIVVGDNWWLERFEYDGSEWWEFKTFPKKPKKVKNVSGVYKKGWDETLEYKVI